MSMRIGIAELINRYGLGNAVMSFRRSLRVPLLTVLNYHRIHHPSHVEATDAGVLDATPALLEAQMRLLRQQFTPIGLKELRDWEGGNPLPPNPALVTFDDGYLDCYERALPILKRYEIRATFFIATDYIERRRVFWWDKIAWIVKRSQRKRISMAYPSPATFSMEGGSSEVVHALFRQVKMTFCLDIDRFIDELAEAAGVPWDESQEVELANELLMTWEQIRELRAAGMDIGSHTKTHRPLETLDVEDLYKELRGSKEELEGILSEPIDSIAYPVGRPIVKKAILRKAVASAGYRMGFTHDTGVQKLAGDVDALDINRFAAAIGKEESIFRAALAIPPLGWTRSDVA